MNEIFSTAFRHLAFMGVVFVFASATNSSAWGQPAAPMPFMADCILLQQTYLNRTTAEFDKGGRAAVAEAYELEKKSYANVQSQPDPVLVVAQIKNHIETLSKPGLPQQSIKFTQDNLARQESMLCWMDYFAKRPQSFPASARTAHMAELRAQEQRSQEAEIAKEAARPDDPKTVGRGATLALAFALDCNAPFDTYINSLPSFSGSLMRNIVPSLRTDSAQLLSEARTGKVVPSVYIPAYQQQISEYRNAENTALENHKKLSTTGPNAAMCNPQDGSQASAWAAARLGGAFATWALNTVQCVSGQQTPKPIPAFCPY